MKCPKCSKKVNKANLKGIPWNDIPLSKPKIKWYCPSCYKKEKSQMNQAERVSLETKWEILDQIIDAKNNGHDVIAEAWIENYPEYAKFIKDHIKLDTYILRAIQYEIRRRLPKGTLTFHQTKIIKPGDVFA